MIQGHCECNCVSYEADCEILDFSHCHCSQCRRLHGAAFATFASIATDNFQYLSGKEDIKEYASSDDLKRVFCGNCGSNILVSLNDVPEILYLSMGAIDGNPTHPEAYHIYVGSKAPWYEITDGSVQYDEAPPEL
jgi:hypothetical protein